MPDDRRLWHPGGTYFFTVNLLQRHTFHRWVAQGLYPPDWAGGMEATLDYKD